MEIRGNRETSTNREAGGAMQAIRKAMVPTDFWTIVLNILGSVIRLNEYFVGGNVNITEEFESRERKKTLG